MWVTSHFLSHLLAIIPQFCFSKKDQDVMKATVMRLPVNLRPRTGGPHLYLGTSICIARGPVLSCSITTYLESTPSIVSIFAGLWLWGQILIIPSHFQELICFYYTISPLYTGFSPAPSKGYFWVWNYHSFTVHYFHTLFFEYSKSQRITSQKKKWKHDFHVACKTCVLNGLRQRIDNFKF